MNLNLRKFDMSSIDDDKVIVLIGKRDTGKSFLCKDLLYYHQDIPVGTVISATESANQFYGNMVPPLFIHDEYNEEIVQRVLHRQKKAVEKHVDQRRKCFEVAIRAHAECRSRLGRRVRRPWRHRAEGCRPPWEGVEGVLLQHDTIDKPTIVPARLDPSGYARIRAMV